MRTGKLSNGDSLSVSAVSNYSFLKYPNNVAVGERSPKETAIGYFEPPVRLQRYKVAVDCSYLRLVVRDQRMRSGIVGEYIAFSSFYSSSSREVVIYVGIVLLISGPDRSWDHLIGEVVTLLLTFGHLGGRRYSSSHPGEWLL